MNEDVKVDQKLRKVNHKLASQNFANVGLTTTSTAQTSVVDGGEATFTVTTEHVDDLRLFVTEHFSVYEGSATAANKIPVGDNISNYDYEVASWYDWGATNNNNVVIIVWVHNRSGSDQTIILKINSRFVIEDATTGAA